MWTCGATQVNGEDILPRWVGRVLSELVPPGNSIRQALPRYSPTPFTTKQHVKTIGAASGPKRFIVCESCNSGWMAMLEGRAKRIMEPMILGRVDAPDGIELDRESLSTINRWVTKSALVYDFITRPPTASEAIRHRFYVTREPFAQSRIWLGSHVPEDAQLTEVWPIRLVREGTGSPVGLFKFTIRIGYLVMQLLLDVRDQPEQVPRRPEPNPLLIQTWPDHRGGSWPPPEAMNGELLDAFARRL
jgi:hypothetical protein